MALNLIDANTSVSRTISTILNSDEPYELINGVASNSNILVTEIVISNVITQPIQITAQIYINSIRYRFANSIIPTNCSLNLINKNIYLDEGQVLQLTTDLPTSAEAVISFNYITPAIV